MTKEPLQWQIARIVAEYVGNDRDADEISNRILAETDLAITAKPEQSVVRRVKAAMIERDLFKPGGVTRKDAEYVIAALTASEGESRG